MLCSLPPQLITIRAEIIILIGACLFCLFICHLIGSEGWIGAAILDVFSPEPLDKSSELWAHPNVIITPHVAAVSLPHLVSFYF
mgnify:CR=1 FL=1